MILKYCYFQFKILVVVQSQHFLLRSLILFAWHLLIECNYAAKFAILQFWNSFVFRNLINLMYKTCNLSLFLAFDFNAKYTSHKVFFTWCFLSRFAHFKSICEHIWFNLHVSHWWLYVLCKPTQNWFFVDILQMFVVCSNFWHLFHCVSSFVLMNSIVLHIVFAIIMFF